MQGQQLVNNISTKQKEAYKKPIYYNSAKFFDVEYQVYGEVSLKNEADKHLYWESEDRRKCVRMVSRDGKFVGLNSLGIRYRHRVCEDWIKNEISIEQAIDELPKANFDPEFYPNIEKQLIPHFKENLKRT